MNDGEGFLLAYAMLIGIYYKDSWYNPSLIMKLHLINLCLSLIEKVCFRLRRRWMLSSCIWASSSWTNFRCCYL